MAQKKQRNRPHVMEDESFKIINNLLPNEWVIREFNRPDYGIDLVIELFENIDDEFSETLGEYLYVQVKSKESIEIKSEKVFPVKNVSKGYWEEDKTLSTDIDIVKFSMDTNSLFTIQTLSASISVLLFLVDLSSKEVYFVCLNDYIDKLILPKNPNYGDQGSVTLNIPTMNVLSDPKLSLSALKFYGKRAKLLSAFSRFAYQKNEITHLLNFENSNLSIQKAKIQVLFFIRQIEHLEIWKYKEWSLLGDMKIQLCNLKYRIEKDEITNEEFIQSIINTWEQLTNLNNIYEELTREWFLPKYLSLLLSYPKADNFR